MSFWLGFKRIFTWWDGQTYGTQLWSARHGVLVGEDDQGNTFFRNKDDTRRWVLYNGDNEASRIAPDWHGWLHRTWDEAPSERPMRHKPWEQPHVPNLTGTALAYAPQGSIRRAEPLDRKDYESWTPE
jgi:NADH:ubiquinone oxidoreductase subunit